MDLKKAMEIFNLQSLSGSNTEAEIKKRYRKLMLKYHPDVSGEESRQTAQDISLAYSILKKALKEDKKHPSANTNKVNKRKIILPVYNLVEIYKGNVITLCSGHDVLELSRGNMSDFDIAVETNVIIQHNNTELKFSSIETMRQDDCYVVNCEITVDEIANTEDVTIYTGKFDTNTPNKINSSITKSLGIKSQSLKIIFTLEYNIKIAVVITKKINKH